MAIDDKAMRIHLNTYQTQAELFVLHLNLEYCVWLIDEPIAIIVTFSLFFFLFVFALVSCIFIIQ